MMRRIHPAFTAALLVVSLVSPADGKSVAVSNAGEFKDAVARAQPGDELILSPGNYGMMALTKSGVTIKSKDNDHPARFSGVIARGVSNVTFDHLDIGRDRGAEPEYAKIVELRDVHGVRFLGGSIHGSLDGNPENDMWGLYARGVTGLQIVGTLFEELYRGLIIDQSSDVLIARNDFRTLRSDGINLAGSSKIFVIGNYIRGFSPAPGDHPDGIQGWTSGQTAGLTNVLISDNFIEGTKDIRVQGVFIRDEKELWKSNTGHKSIVIQKNIIVDPMWQGIYLGDTQNGVVSGNTILNERGGQVVPGGPVVPWIKFSPGTKATGNLAPRFLLDASAQPESTPRGNNVGGNVKDRTKIEAARAEWLGKRAGLPSSLSAAQSFEALDR